MGFGNPYNDPYDPDIVLKFAEILKSIGVRTISLADTIGIATKNQIAELFEKLKASEPNMEFGVHLHSDPSTAKEKVAMAFEAGCRRFDGALLGFGGCPMADNELVGNIDTSVILQLLSERQEEVAIDQKELQAAKKIASDIFPGH